MSTATTSSTETTSLISWTATGGNKLKEYELVTKGLDIKLSKNGNNFTEWNEAVAFHAKVMGMNELFTCGPSTCTTYPIHSQFPVKSPSLKPRHDYLRSSQSILRIHLRSYKCYSRGRKIQRCMLVQVFV